MIYLYIYLIVIAVLIAVYFILHNHEQKIAKRLNQWIDKILFLFDRTVYTRKNAFVDYESAKWLLFHNQKNFFAKPTVYADLLPLLLKDAEYATSLVKQEIISQKDTKDLLETQEVWQKLYTIKKYTHIIITFLTLWIGKILLPR